MSTPLFELYATLGLDATDFTEEAKGVVEDTGGIADDVSEAFLLADADYKQAKKDLVDLELESGTAGAIIDGFVGTVGDLTKEAIEALINFASDSLALVKERGGETAELLTDSEESFAIAYEAFQLKTGKALVPIAVRINEIKEDLTGISETEKLTVLFDRLESYSFANLEKLNGQLSSIFGMFDQVEAVEARSIEEMTKGVQSQASYWTDYADTLADVKAKGVDASFLAEIADGSKSSLETLKALAEADESQIEALMSSFTVVEQARGEVAKGLNETQLEVDEYFTATKDSINDLVANIDTTSAYNAAKSLGDNLSSGLSDSYPGIVSWVDSIIAELARIGGAYDVYAIVPERYKPGANGYNGTGLPNFASGLTYVPYDNYTANLHRGETVLTRQQAEEYRSGSGAAAAFDADALAMAVRGALNGAVVQMDGHTVGTLLTETVSRNIAQNARRERRYG